MYVCVSLCDSVSKKIDLRECLGGRMNVYVSLSMNECKSE